MQGNSDIGADGARDGNGASSAPRIRELPFRRKLLPLLAIAAALPAGQAIAMGFLYYLDSAEWLASAPLFLTVILPTILFVPEARPRTRRHWFILCCSTCVATVLGMLGTHLAMRLITPITEPTLLGGLPGLLAGMLAGAGIAIGVWLLVRRATRGEGLWIGPMIDREPAR